MFDIKEANEIINGTRKNFSISISVNDLTTNQKIDELLNFLSKVDYYSVVEFDKCIYLNGSSYSNNIKNFTIYDRTKSYPEFVPLVKNLYDKLCLKTKFDLYQNPNFINLLHCVRFFELYEIRLVDEDKLEAMIHEFRGEIDKDNIYWKLGFYTGRDIVYLCPNAIVNSINQEKKDKKIFSLYKEHLLENVLYHEIGHHVFLYKDAYLPLPIDKEFKEKQANYYSSYVVSGKNDVLINYMTFHQPDYYKDPMLYTNYVSQYNDFDNSDIKKLYIRDPNLKIIKSNKHYNMANNRGNINNVKKLSRAEKAKRLFLKAIDDGKINKNNISSFFDKNFCNIHFGLCYPLLILEGQPCNHDRYHVTKDAMITAFGSKYYFCNDWNEKRLLRFTDFINSL